MENNVAKRTSKYKLFIFLGIEILVVLTVFLLIFFAGRRTYTVTFDINDGELLSGDLVQHVRRGGDATPPNVARQGCYLLRWSGSYKKITGNVKCTAVWEYETTPGIEYEIIEGGNYCLISGCYKDLSGDVYVGSYYNNIKVLGIKDGAFKDCKYIESLYFLDGIISIGNNAFEGCESLERITLPDTTERIGNEAFKGCDSLTEITIPGSVKSMGSLVFDNPNLSIYVDISQEDCLNNDNWSIHWLVQSKSVMYSDAEVEEDDTDAE